MSLITEIQLLSELDVSLCKRLVAECCIDGLEAAPVNRKKSKHWQFWETGEGLFGDDMLLDDADWDAAYWRVRPAAAAALVSILSRIIDVSPLGIDFSI